MAARKSFMAGGEYKEHNGCDQQPIKKRVYKLDFTATK